MSSHIDSIDVSPTHVVLGLSNLEGNIWDGSLKLFARIHHPDDGFSLEEVATQRSSAGVSMCRFAGHGREYVVAARDDGHIAIYFSTSLDRAASYCAHDDIVSAIAVNPSEPNQFASCSWDGSIKVWDLSCGDEKGPHLVAHIKHAHYKHINDIAYHPQNSSLLCSCGQDGFIRLWDLQSDHLLDSECLCIYNLHQSLSCICWDKVNYTNEGIGGIGESANIFVGTDAGDIITIDLKFDNTGAPLIIFRPKHTF